MILLLFVQNCCVEQNAYFHPMNNMGTMSLSPKLFESLSAKAENF